MAESDDHGGDGGDGGDVDWSVGPKVERFYMSYRTADENIPDLIDAVYQLEHHTPLTSIGETQEVILEIISDCQKKAAQAIRAAYADQVRSMITAIRKKLVSKVSLDADSSAQHGQRHLNSLLELLGMWSNMVDHIRSSHWGISGTLFRLTISQLHERVIELALECFLKFREDKQLDSWQTRVSEAAVSKSSFSIIALDFLLSQMSAMRDIVQQYYRFLRKAFLSIEIDSMSIESNGESNASEADVDRAVEAHVELMVSAQERNKWRELDAVYISLEFGYLSNSIKEALTEPLLLEVEKDVFVPQAIEDVFFLLLRVVERALATGNEGSAFSVGNYIVELLDPIQESKVFQLISLRRTYRGCHKNKMIIIDNNNNDNNDDNDESIVTSRSTNSLTPSTNNIKNNNSEKKSNRTDSPIPPTPPTTTTTTSLPTSILTGVAVASFSGVNNWLMSLAESAAPLAPSPPIAPPTGPHIGPIGTSSSNPNTGRNENEKSKMSIHSAHNSNTPPISSSSNKGIRPLSSSGTLESLLLSALDLDVRDMDEEGGKEPESTPLRLKDVAVHLTTLALAPSAITSLSNLFCPIGGDNSGGGGGGKASSLTLISEELSRCRASYYLLLRTEANALAVGIFQRYVSPALFTTFSKSYDIGGDVMERRTGDCEILRILRAIIPPPPNSESGIEGPRSVDKRANGGTSSVRQSDAAGGAGGPSSERTDQQKEERYESEADIAARLTKGVRDLLGKRMSAMARTEVLLQLALVINTHFIDAILRTSFSEWGALLLHQEALSVIRIFDEACDDVSSMNSMNGVMGGGGGGGGGNGSSGVGGVTSSSSGSSVRVAASAKEVFSPLSWGVKILTLDQPVDIKKYSIPYRVTDMGAGSGNGSGNISGNITGRGGGGMVGSGNSNGNNGNSNGNNSNNSNNGSNGSSSSGKNDICTPGMLSEGRIRRIMCNRIDFSKDAAMKVKITFK